MSDLDKFKQVEVRSEGVFLVNEKKLSLAAFRRQKTRLETRILDLQNSQRHHEVELKRNAKLIQHLEQQLASFTSSLALEWEMFMEQQKAEERERKIREKQETNKRANQLLLEYLGEKAHAELMKKGLINFMGRDGKTYQIDKKGALFRNNRRLCMIRPSNLPLPDFIVSIITTVKEVGRIE